MMIAANLSACQDLTRDPGSIERDFDVETEAHCLRTCFATTPVANVRSSPDTELQDPDDTLFLQTRLAAAEKAGRCREFF